MSRVRGFLGAHRAEIRNYCEIHCQEEVQETLRIADDVCNNHFLFESKWEMERTYIPVTFEKGEIAWDRIPFGDPEWVYAMNRNRYFITLAQAYVLTGNEKYTLAFIDLLEHWIQSNPLTPERHNTTWRTIETGLRAENWLKAYEIFKVSEIWDYAIEEKLKASLVDHAEHIMAHNDDFRRLSNWGVIENHGLFLIGVLLPELERSKVYIETAKERLELAITRQVRGDGMHWEQSQLYHNEVLRAFVDVLICSENNGITFSESFKSGVYAMVDTTMHMTKPNHMQLANGDSDDMDARDILVRAAVLYEDPILKGMAYPDVDFESIWDIGWEGVIRYQALGSSSPQVLARNFEDSGNYCMRDTWEENGSFVHFKCGTLGGGHGHVDLLHVDLMYKGQDILIDKGRYTYVDSKERYYLKSCEGHNTTVVDAQPFTKIQDTWGYSNMANPVQGRVVNKEIFDYVEGMHLGYMGLENPVVVGRKLLWIKPNILVISDSFHGRGSHTYNQYFHFAKGSLMQEEDHIAYTSGPIKAQLYTIGDVHYECMQTQSAPTYNALEETPSLKTTFEGEGLTSRITVLVMSNEADTQKFAVEQVPISIDGVMHQDHKSIQAVKIQCGETSHIVTIRHEELQSGRQLICVEGEYIYGRVALTQVECGKRQTQIVVG
ncbi:MAG: alginate lyase family protein [Cellulosilyticaceae bacterium]